MRANSPDDIQLFKLLGSRKFSPIFRKLRPCPLIDLLICSRRVQLTFRRFVKVSLRGSL
jgi:hypothetical protein